MGSKRDLLVELGYESSVVFENPDFDDAIIGTDDNSRVVYDYDKMVECLMKEDGMDYEEAVELIRALPYVENAPIVVHGIEIYDEHNKPFKMDTEEEIKNVSEKCIKWIRDWFEENGKGCNAILGISGGKDSLISAALCARAIGPDRVIGIAMPDINQGTNEAEEICKYLGIKYYCIPIDGITGAINFSLGLNGEEVSKQTEQNIPPRVRMAVLYGFAQSHNGRVVGTCNASENYIGYFTRYGDGASDVEPLGNLTVRQVKKIGYYLGLPKKWIEKTPDDGLPNSEPDDAKFSKMGFNYEKLDKYIENGTSGESNSDDAIEKMHEKNKFKMNLGVIFKNP